MGKLTHTVSGNPVSFLSADKAIIDSLKVNFLPVQEGTGDPSPSNVRPITGCQAVTVSHHNRNLINPADYVASDGEKSIVVENNGLFSKANWFFNLRSYAIAQSRILAAKFSGKKLTFAITAYSDGNSLVDDGNGLAFVIQHDNGSTNDTYYWLNSDTSPRTHTFTVSGLTYFFFSYSTGGANYWHVTNFQVEIGEDATDFMPYAGNTYAVTFPNEIGTVYGGVLDLAAGTLTATYAMIVYDGSSDENWSESGDGWSWSSETFVTHWDELGTISPNPNIYNRCLCDSATVASNNNRDPQDVNSIHVSYYHYSNVAFHAPLGSNATVADLRAYLAQHPLTIINPYVVDSKRPVYQLTAQQLKTFIGHNSIFSNANSSVDVTYEFTDYLSKKRVLIGDPMVLPPEYQKYDWLESYTNNAKLDTGVSGNDSTLEIFCDFMPIEIGESYAGIFGNYKTESANYCWRLILQKNTYADYNRSFYFTAGNGAPSGTYGATRSLYVPATDGGMINRRLQIDMTYGKAIISWQGGSSSGTATTTATEANTTNIAIGASAVGSSGGSTRFRYYEFKMKSHGVLIRNYIPVIRKSDSKAGFYDVVNHTFNPSIGTVEFIAGNDT